MKAKRTMRDIKSQYPTIIQVSYCDLQNMFCMDDPPQHIPPVRTAGTQIFIRLPQALQSAPDTAPSETSNPIGKRSAITKSGRGKCAGICGTLRSWRSACTTCRRNLFRRYATYEQACF